MAVVLLFFHFFFLVSYAGRIAEPDLSALLSIKANLSDPLNYFEGWIPENDCSLWDGVICSTSSRVTFLNLAYGSHSGPVPAALNTLNDLQSLFLDGNFLFGPLPKLNALTRLQTISMTGNFLSGSLDVLTALPSLKYLYAATNRFSGSIPDAFGSQKSFIRLELSGNSLSGPIPSSFTNLVRLESLRLDSNLLNGSIPTNIGFLTQLKYMNLTANKLTGVIPNSLSSLIRVMDLGLGHNGLTGNLPAGLYFLRRLRLFDVSYNSLIGPAFTNSSSPYFNRGFQQNNTLSGFPAIPQFNNLFICAKLYLAGNCLDYTRPTEFCASPQRAPDECLSICKDTRPVLTSCTHCPVQNPCGLGQTIFEINRATYSCFCPKGYTPGRLSLTLLPTCVPAVRQFTTVRVPHFTALTCRAVYESLGIPKENFTATNLRLNCGRYPIPGRFAINVTYTDTTCTAVYRLNKNDTCSSLASLFKKAIAGPNSPNPDLDCCNLLPNNKVCLKMGTTPSQALCQTFYTLASGETCQTVIGKYFSGKAFDFFNLNPGLYCDALKSATGGNRRVCIKGISQRTRDSMCKSGITDTVRAGQNCASIYAKYFQGQSSLFVSANSGVQCVDSLLYVGFKYCVKY